MNHDHCIVNEVQLICNIPNKRKRERRKMRGWEGGKKKAKTVKKYAKNREKVKVQCI